MSAASKYDPSNEILVRREEILELFSEAQGKRPSKAAFFRYVDQGVVKKARQINGWYKLNATRVSLGMGEVEVNRRVMRRLAVKQFLRDAQARLESVIEVDESFESQATSFSRADELAPSEEQDVQREALRHRNVLDKLRNQDARDAYLKGYTDALNSLMDSESAYRLK